MIRSPDGTGLENADCSYSMDGETGVVFKASLEHLLKRNPQHAKRWEDGEILKKFGPQQQRQHRRQIALQPQTYAGMHICTGALARGDDSMVHVIVLQLQMQQTHAHHCGHGLYFRRHYAPSWLWASMAMRPWTIGHVSLLAVR